MSQTMTVYMIMSLYTLSGLETGTEVSENNVWSTADQNPKYVYKWRIHISVLRKHTPPLHPTYDYGNWSYM